MAICWCLFQFIQSSCLAGAYLWFSFRSDLRPFLGKIHDHPSARYTAFSLSVKTRKKTTRLPSLLFHFYLSSTFIYILYSTYSTVQKEPCVSLPTYQVPTRYLPGTYLPTYVIHCEVSIGQVSYVKRTMGERSRFH